MEKEKKEMSKTLERLTKSYEGTKVVERMGAALSDIIYKAAQEQYAAEIKDDKWGTSIAREIVDIYESSGIEAKLSESQIQIIDKALARSTHHTTFFGIGHEDAGSYAKFHELKKATGLEISQLPEYHKAIQKTYADELGFCRECPLSLFKATGIKPDLEAIAKQVRVHIIEESRQPKYPGGLIDIGEPPKIHFEEKTYSAQELVDKTYMLCLKEEGGKERSVEEILSDVGTVKKMLDIGPSKEVYEKIMDTIYQKL